MCPLLLVGDPVVSVIRQAVLLHTLFGWSTAICWCAVEPQCCLLICTSAEVSAELCALWEQQLDGAEFSVFGDVGQRLC